MFLPIALLSALTSLVAAAPGCTPSTTDYNLKLQANTNFCIDNVDGRAVSGNPVQVWV